MKEINFDETVTLTVNLVQIPEISKLKNILSSLRNYLRFTDEFLAEDMKQLIDHEFDKNQFTELSDYASTAKDTLLIAAENEEIALEALYYFIYDIRNLEASMKQIKAVGIATRQIIEQLGD